MRETSRLDRKGWNISIRPSVPTEEEIASMLDDGYEIEVIGLSMGVLMKKRKRYP